MSEARLCVVCPALHSDREPRTVATPTVCDSCRRHLADLHIQIPASYAALPAMLERGWTMGANISGGDPYAALPFRDNVWDLLQPPDSRTVTDPHHDQAGLVSAATTLHSWIEDWLTYRDRGEVGPAEPTVAALCGWLADRLDWACDHHPAIDDYAFEVNRLAAQLRRYAGADAPRPQPCTGIPCRRCDLQTLARLADGSGDVECQNGDCRAVYRADEYRRWTIALAARSTREAVDA